LDVFSALNLCERAALNCSYGCQNDTNGVVGCFCPIGLVLAANNIVCEGKFSKANRHNLCHSSKHATLG